ncbi:MAG TPA: hypothetical protein PKK48_06450, partial [Phycisphaerae bacterium]|nr:hypothetical protein [Phycisphaerae bacterium]
MEMHVLPEKKQTMFWLIIGTEITGIVVMIGLLAYKKFIADHFFTSHERKPAVSVSYTSRPTHSARPLFAQTRVESDTPVKIESVPAAAAVACVQSQPAEEAVPAKLSSASPDAAEPSTPEISDLNEQGDSSSWQIFSEENKSDKNSAAAGPPLPKVIKNPKIIVIKSRQILEVYDGGKLLRTYQASTGSNPGDKEKSGDRKTPEGE